MIKPTHHSTNSLNHLRRGRVYRALTAKGFISGEYLGIETPYGEWALLLRDARGTESIRISDIRWIEQAAA